MALGIIYFFLVLSAILVFGNIAIKLASDKKLQFVYNCTILITLFIVLLYQDASGLYSTSFQILSANPFSLFLMMIFTLGMLIVNLIALPYADFYEDFALLGSFALLGMYFVAFANSLITIFIGLELASIPSVFIILLSRRSMEAATKFFIMASISVALLSFAIVLVYGAENSLVLRSYQPTLLMAFAAMLFIISLGFESSIFPFNVLIPDVYEGSQAYVTAMLGGINKKVGFAALLQVMILVFILDKSALLVVALLSVFTMFYGNILALIQNNLKRMLAYSSISQAGYIMIGIASATASGVSASLFQMFAHMFAFIGILGIFSFLESKNKRTIDDLLGLNSESRLLAFSLTILLLSLLGMPLTTGFIGKFLLFVGAVNANLTWLAIFGIINSVISVFYYAKILMAVYATKANAHSLSIDRTVFAAIIACLFITIAFGVYPQPFLSLANSAGTFLINAP